jgi:hypothetical protein
MLWIYNTGSLDIGTSVIESQTYFVKTYSFYGARPSGEAFSLQIVYKKCANFYIFFPKILDLHFEISKHGIGSRGEWNADPCLAFMSLLLSGAAMESGKVVTNALKIFGRIHK